MSQSTYVRGSGLSGTSYRTADNDAKAAIVSSHKGSSRPSYALAGTVWVDDSANPVHTLYYYDGADDISLGSINVTTNVYVPASNTASVAEVLTGTDSAKSATPDAVAALWEQGSDIASASSLAIPSSGGGYFFVTGTTTITALSQGAALKTGREVTLKFNGILTLTHNATSLILPGGANITTAAGDVASFRCEDAGNNYWRCTKYTRADGTPVVDTGGFPKGFIGGPQPTYNTAASITIPTGCRARSSDNTADIEAAGNLTVSLASSGANGLDTGAEANDTWYYVYLIKKSSDGTVAGLLSVTNEAASGTITQPSGYDLKRQLPLAIRNDGSGNIIPFYIGGGWPMRPHVLHRDYEDSATYQVLNAGTSTTFAAVSLSGLVPPIAKLADLYVDAPNVGTGAGGVFLRATGSGLSTGRKATIQLPNDLKIGEATDVQTDASQSIDYRVAATPNGQTSLWVWGYTVTEVN